MSVETVAPAEADASARPMDLLRFATAGSVDDGKSTLIGRLLYDTSLELLVQVLTVFGVILQMRHEKYAGQAHASLLTSRA